MELSGARVVVCGASGVLGGQIARALAGRGARVVAAGRTAERLVDLANELGSAPLTFDLLDLDSCTRVIDDAATALGGLDALVVATGVAGFGPAMDADPAVVEELFAVNTLGPMHLVRAAAGVLTEGGCVAVISAILADLPTAGMADYSASKSALAAWLGVVRRENRRRFHVVDVRPPHLDTGLAERALAGEPPRLPAGHPVDDVVALVLEAMSGDKREVVYDAGAKDLVVR